MGISDTLFFVAALGVLFYSGGIMVRSLTILGQYLHMSEYALSFILAAFATSLPEFFIGVTSAWRGVPMLSLGNIVCASFLHVNEYALSFILAAFATSLPEFFIGVTSAWRGVPMLSLGNIVCASFLNVTAVLGIV